MANTTHAKRQVVPDDAQPILVAVRAHTNSESWPSSSSTGPGQIPVEHFNLLDELSQLLIEVHRLTARVASEEFSPAEREVLRKLASHDGVPRVFELSNFLYRCCGERIRNLLIRPDVSAGE